MFVCSGCQKEYESFSNFCIACGGKIEKKAEVPTESKYICCGCQKEYEPTTKFCSECGGKVEKRVFELIPKTNISVPDVRKSMILQPNSAVNAAEK